EQQITGRIATLSPDQRTALMQALAFDLESGIDEIAGEHPAPWLIDSAHSNPVHAELATPSPRPRQLAQKAVPADSTMGQISRAPNSQTALLPLDSQAEALAQPCKNLDELQQALGRFDGCPLKDTATNLVFGDGKHDADLMIIGEAPGADEDRIGRPFVGVSGQLLDTMLAAIGCERSQFYITNTLYWRPPGNRTPTDSEVMACLPFLRRQITLIDPKILLLVGGRAAKALLGETAGVTKLRGSWFRFHGEADQTIPALVSFHPAYLLRVPANKRLAWRDLCALAERMAEMGIR
ncbi:MAG: uracil-DNA glycosylase, partial [Pseudomonadota bacterium]